MSSESLAEEIYSEFHPTQPEQRFEHPMWFGATVLGDWRLCYAVRAQSLSEAREKLAAEFDSDGELGPTPMHLYSKRQHQNEFNARYEGQDIVRVIPFSTEPFPAPGQAELTSGQTEALEKFQPGLSKTWTDPRF